MKRREALAHAVHDQLHSTGFYLFVNLWSALILIAVVHALLAWVAAA